MSRRRGTFTEQQLQELQRAYQRAKDAATRTRYQAVKLYGEGYPVHEILHITGSNRTSLMEWCRKYRQQGITRLQDHRGGPQCAKLTAAQMTELTEKLHQYQPYDLLGPQCHTASGQHWTVPDLAQVVEQTYGVRWQSRTSYHQVFVACGFSYQHTEKVYKSRRERDVLDFEAAVEKK